MQFIVTILDDADAVYDLIHFCKQRRLDVRPYKKRGEYVQPYKERAAPGIRTKDPAGRSSINEPSPARKAILQALKLKSPKQKYLLYAELPTQFSQSAINSTLWTCKELGFIKLKYNKYSITQSGILELKKLEKEKK